MKKTVSLLLLSGILFAPMAILAEGETPALPTTGPAALTAVPAVAPAEATATPAAASTPAVKQSIHKKTVKKGSKGKAAKKSAKHSKKAVKKSTPATTTAPVPAADKPAIYGPWLLAWSSAVWCPGFSWWRWRIFEGD